MPEYVVGPGVAQAIACSDERSDRMYIIKKWAHMRRPLAAMHVLLACG
jgi:hypothetical protein